MRPDRALSGAQGGPYHLLLSLALFGRPGYDPWGAKTPVIDGKLVAVTVNRSIRRAAWRNG